MVIKSARKRTITWLEDVAVPIWMGALSSLETRRDAMKLLEELRQYVENLPDYPVVGDGEK